MSNNRNREHAYIFKSMKCDDFTTKGFHVNGSSLNIDFDDISIINQHDMILSVENRLKKSLKNTRFGINKKL